MSLLLLALLLPGCSSVPAPVQVAPPAEEASVASGPEPAPPLLFQVFVGIDEGSVTALRVRESGEVELATGDPRALGWRVERHLAPLDVSELKALLGSDELAAVPDRLVRPPGAPDHAPTASWTLATPDGERRIVHEGYTHLRIPALERLEHLVRAGRRAPPVHARFVVRGENGPVTHDVPCDPRALPPLRTLLTPLLDSTMAQTAPASDAVGEPLLRVDWGAGSRAWQTRYHENGVIVRLDEQRRATAGRLDLPHREIVARLLAEVDWERAAAACR